MKTNRTLATFGITTCALNLALAIAFIAGGVEPRAWVRATIGMVPVQLFLAGLGLGVLLEAWWRGRGEASR